LSDGAGWPSDPATSCVDPVTVKTCCRVTPPEGGGGGAGRTLERTTYWMQLALQAVSP